MKLNKYRQSKKAGGMKTKILAGPIDQPQELNKKARIGLSHSSSVGKAKDVKNNNS